MFITLGGQTLHTQWLWSANLVQGGLVKGNFPLLFFFLPPVILGNDFSSPALIASS
jgi:hypothetical protein